MSYGILTITIISVAFITYFLDSIVISIIYITLSL